ncbi:MAG TPA: MFS transporter [Baekduia sp.]|jgi:EmrB/QacA subfamily drug resistance transporter
MTHPSATRSHQTWTVVLASIGVLMTSLDTLVVTTSLPVLRNSLHASLSSLEWTVNAYNLAFACLLLTGAALGDRFGRRRMFTIGVGVFTAASVLSAVSPSVGTLIAARALQGAGAAIVMPLTLTLISEAFPTEKRGVAIGLWGGIQGLAVAAGPVVGGAIAGGISWHWIFWLNVPIGLALMPLAARRLSESYGPRPQLDVGGLVLAAAAALAITWGLVRAEAAGWTSAEVLGSLGAGLVLGTSFIRWEARTPTPMLKLALFRDRTFATANAVSFFSFAALFGVLFLMAQFFQIALGHAPLHAGLELLPWTGAPMIVAPIAGALSERYGNRPFMAAGLALQTIGLAWVALIAEPGMGYLPMGVALTIAGIGISLCFPTVANAVMGAVPLQEAGVASGTNSMLRELGGVLGIAVLASVFASHGGYASPAVFVDGFTKALWVGVGLSAAGCVAALLAPRRSAAVAGDLVPAHPEAALDLS